MNENPKSNSSSSNSKSWIKEQKSPRKEITIFNEIFNNKVKENFDAIDDHIELKKDANRKLPKLFKVEPICLDKMKEKQKNRKRKVRLKMSNPS